MAFAHIETKEALWLAGRMAGCGLVKLFLLLPQGGSIYHPKLNPHPQHQPHMANHAGNCFVEERTRKGCIVDGGIVAPVALKATIV
jgi:hypothetical protein